MKSSLSLSIIIPVYNEIELVDRQVRRMDAFMAAHVADHELIIIESGSTDGSGEACDRLARELPRVRLIHEGARNGYGAAVRLGFAQAGKDLLISIPVDLPFPLEVLPKGLRLIEASDCILSYREMDDRSLFRRVQAHIYNILIRKLRFREIPVVIPEREAGISKVRLTDPLRVLRELLAFKRGLNRLRDLESQHASMSPGD
jgi:glycosyltransferase involved in cell wall biosynthesis